MLRTALLIVLSTTWLDSVQAQEGQIYVAVAPCRVADTRQSSEGAIKANTHRDFHVFGSSAELANQGGEVNCPNPRPGQETVGVAAYILAIPNDSSTGKGVLTVYPSNQLEPPVGSGSTVNFGQGQTIGNTTISTLCVAGCPQGGEMAVLARNSDEDVVIDVQGYFYSMGRQVIQQTYTESGITYPNATMHQRSLVCPEGTVAVSGGYNIPGNFNNLETGPSQSYKVFETSPGDNLRQWDFRYQTLYQSGEGPYDITLYVVCEDT